MARKQKDTLNASLVVRSEAVENFLKAVYSLQEGMERVSTNAVAMHLGFKAPSITDMAQRLAEAGLINYQKYRGMQLTDAGRQTALMVIRRHRLIELYLTQELDYPLHEVHAEAERLEHAVSERFIAALERKLDYPVTDPHGDPIPSAEGHIISSEQIALTMLPTQQRARVVRLNAPNGEMLKHLVERGLMLGHSIEVLRRDPFDGPLLLRVEGESVTLGHQAAVCVMVELD